MYKRVDLKDGTPVQFVAVHAVKWLPAWGQPSVGFIEDDDPVAAAAAELLDLLALIIEPFDDIPTEGWWCPECGVTDCTYDGRCANPQCGINIEDKQPDSTVIGRAQKLIKELSKAR